MKTSLILDDRVFEDAKREAHESGRAVSEVVSLWASLGRDLWKSKKEQRSSFKALNLGAEKVDLSDRREWMDLLDAESSSRVKK